MSHGGAEFSYLTNTFNSDIVNAIVANKKVEEKDEGFKVENLKYLVIPAAVFCVFVYQYFFKAKKTPAPSPAKGARAPPNKGRNKTFQELQEMEMEKKFAGLAERMGGSSGEMGMLKKEMDDMRSQLNSLSSGTEGLTANLKAEMEAMKA